MLMLVRNELVKSWRSRWMVFAVLAGLSVVIAGGLYIFYVHYEHRLSPPPPTAWQTTLGGEIADNQTTIENVQRRCPAGTRCVINGLAPKDAIAHARLTIDADRYMIDNNIAPVIAYPISRAALFGLGGVIVFVLIRIFGWLAAEQIAGERSERTLAILLSRPHGRDQILLAKTVASFVIALGVVLVSFLVVYAIFAFIMGSAGPVTGQVGLAIDASKPLAAANFVIMPLPLFVLMCVGATMLAVLCVQGMSLLISVVTGRWAAVGVTLAVLFGASFVSGLVTSIITVISGSADSADFLNYAFFNALAPVGSITAVAGNAQGAGIPLGLGVFRSQVVTLLVWTVAFFGGAFYSFHRHQEAG
jgi:ABC-2 type transport system permease protein